MAYWINQAGNSTRPNWRQFYCDADSDISALPTTSKEGKKQLGDSTSHKCCSVGSECLSIETTSVYVLDSSDIWRKL